MPGCWAAWWRRPRVEGGRRCEGTPHGGAWKAGAGCRGEAAKPPAARGHSATSHYGRERAPTQSRAAARPPPWAHHVEGGSQCLKADVARVHACSTRGGAASRAQWRLGVPASAAGWAPAGHRGSGSSPSAVPPAQPPPQAAAQSGGQGGRRHWPLCTLPPQPGCWKRMLQRLGTAAGALAPWAGLPRLPTRSTRRASSASLNAGLPSLPRGQS